MTQNGVVTKKLPDGRAEVSILRGTACGGNCGGCEACQYNSHIQIEADNPIHAAEGDRVIVASSTSGIMRLTLFIYMLPLFSFFVCYAIAYATGCREGTSIALSFIGFALGSLAVVLIGRRKKTPRYELTGFIR